MQVIKTVRLSLRQTLRDIGYVCKTAFEVVKDFVIGLGVGFFLLFFWVWFGDHEKT